MTARAAAPAAASLTPGDLDHLVVVAATAIVACLDGRRWCPDVPARGALAEPGAAFVTLHDAAGDLLGCVGTLEARDPLVVTVADRARAAATADPRFEPVTRARLAGGEVEVSVLSPLEPLAVSGHADLLRALRPGVDGLAVEVGRHRATFLPTVWRQVDDPAWFLALLWRKAGLLPEQWPPGLRAYRYTTRTATRRWPVSGV